MSKRIKTKDICITGLGIALFVVLSMCLRVPIFENYYVCLGYVVMTVYLYGVGIFSGTLVGCVGTLIYCFLINGLRGMPGWILGNLVIGLCLGCVMKRVSKHSNSALTFIVLGVTALVATAVGILGAKSLVECVLYSQPVLVRVATNMYAFVADVVTIIASLPLCFVLKKYLDKYIH